MARLTPRGFSAVAGAAAVACVLVVCLSACTPQTVVRVTLDLDSYLDAELKAATAVVPTLQPLVVYLLPGLQVDDSDAGPDENMASGARVTLPSLASYTGVQPRLILEIEALIANEDSSNEAPGLEIFVIVGADDAVNIYDEGTAVVTESFPELTAGRTQTYSVVAVLGPESEAYSELLSGTFRVGISFRLDANPSAPIPVRVRLIRAEATLEFVPFGLLPSGGLS